MGDREYQSDEWGGGQLARVGDIASSIPVVAAALRQRDEFAAAEEDEARAAGEIAYMARLTVQATLPHSDPAKRASRSRLAVDRHPDTGNPLVFVRTNAHHMTLRVTALSSAGLPYGAIPRLLLVWTTTEAVRTRTRDLFLGHSLNEFLEKMELGRGGGPRGDITRLRSQMKRLFSSAISVEYSDDRRDAFQGMTLVDESLVWWDPKRPTQRALWGSSLTLSERFFREVIEHPVPLDVAAVCEVRRSPLAFDIYGWMTWRMSFLKERKVIPWSYLEAQFGAQYSRSWDFRTYFRKALVLVKRAYPDARFTVERRGLELQPSPTSVPSRASARLSS